MKHTAVRVRQAINARVQNQFTFFAAVKQVAVAFVRDDVVVDRTALGTGLDLLLNGYGAVVVLLLQLILRFGHDEWLKGFAGRGQKSTVAEDSLRLWAQGGQGSSALPVGLVEVGRRLVVVAIGDARVQMVVTLLADVVQIAVLFVFDDVLLIVLARERGQVRQTRVIDGDGTVQLRLTEVEDGILTVGILSRVATFSERIVDAFLLSLAVEAAEGGGRGLCTVAQVVDVAELSRRVQLEA